MTAYYQTFSTSLGEFSVAVDQNEHLVATAFGNLEVLRSRLEPGKSAWEFVPDRVRTRDSKEQIEAYFRGERKRFTMALAPRGTPFQKHSWELLNAIPFGETRTYAQVAAAMKSGPRAVGGAAGRNPIALIIPCHRVIGSNGQLTGFAFGEPIKRRLLEHEGVL